MYKMRFLRISKSWWSYALGVHFIWEKTESWFC